MRTSEWQGRSTQAGAWLFVVAVHAGLCLAAGPTAQPRASGQGRGGALATGVPGTRPATASTHSRTLACGRVGTRRSRTNRAPTHRGSAHRLIGHRTHVQPDRIDCGVAGTTPSMGPRTISARLPGHTLAQPTGATAGRRSCRRFPHAPAALAETRDELHRQGIRRSRLALPAPPGQYLGPAGGNLGPGAETGGRRTASRPRVVSALSRDPDPDIPTGAVAESH